TFRRLLGRRNYVRGVIAQFFYVGAQIGVWSFTIRYVMAERGLNEDSAASYYLAAIVLFALSRFICTALMRYIAPHTLLASLAALAALLTVVVMTVGGMTGVLALIGISGCM